MWEERDVPGRARSRELGCWHREQENLEELGKAPQRNRPGRKRWNGLDSLEILGKMAGKGIVRKISSGGSSMKPPGEEGRGQEIGQGQGQRELQWGVFLGFRISHWMSLFREKGS